jgi:hypothetical protein
VLARCSTLSSRVAAVVVDFKQAAAVLADSEPAQD